MILLGSTGGRWTASAALTARPSPARSMSPSPHDLDRACRRAGSGGTPSLSCLRAELGRSRPGEPGRAGRTRRAPGRCRPSSRTRRSSRARRGAVALAERARHHQVMAEPRLGLVPVELRHRVEHPRWSPSVNQSMRSQSAATASGVKMCSTPAASCARNLAQRPEGVAQRARRDQDAPCDRCARSPSAERPSEPQVVLGVGGLADADRDPALVRQALAEELPQVGRRVEDRQVRSSSIAVIQVPCASARPAIACASSGSPGKS